MGNNSNNDLDKIEEEVRQKELEELIIKVVDSENNLNQDFYSAFNQIKKEDREQFLALFSDWILTKKFKLFFDKKYIKSRLKENPLFKYSYLELGRAEIEDYMYLKGLRKKKDLKYPATDFWIDRKTWELKRLLPELNDLHKSLFKISSHTYISPDTYIFPDNLVDKEFDNSLIESFRVPVNSSLENLRVNLQKPLDDLKSIMGDEPFKAFLYNSFQFRDNPTNVVPLNLTYPSNVKIGTFLSEIYDLYVDFDITYSFAKKEFVKIMVLNFSRHRKDFSNANFDLNKHLKAINKRVKKA
ncbi:hypothetical protein Q4Q34_03185 [Flavivirga abyssicola]|uniref:hypothetical protein n=1 Tax=Flavivirga abyssicola TaxID=3063533 RepID=UPI0026E09D96|nr:hypothetical protein [Flavivirga sp. MEBiC07777]WVK14036.1 hypothetical protein Q4Q34_03185 [Flavivirga sp. MEBiC07777]